MSYYQEVIRETAARLGYIGANTRHIEAWIRVGHGTLDALSREMFEEEVEMAIACMGNRPEAESESLARSYGLA